MAKKRQEIFTKHLSLLVCSHVPLANESQRGDNSGNAVVIALASDQGFGRVVIPRRLIGYYDVRGTGSQTVKAIYIIHALLDTKAQL